MLPVEFKQAEAGPVIVGTGSGAMVTFLQFEAQVATLQSGVPVAFTSTA